MCVVVTVDPHGPAVSDMVGQRVSCPPPHPSPPNPKRFVTALKLVSSCKKKKHPIVIGFKIFLCSLLKCISFHLRQRGCHADTVQSIVQIQTRDRRTTLISICRSLTTDGFTLFYFPSQTADPLTPSNTPSSAQHMHTCGITTAPYAL